MSEPIIDTPPTPGITARSTSILQCLTPLEISEFLPGAMAQDIASLGAPLTSLNSDELDVSTWDAKLHETNPEILIACWSTPRLPEKLPANLRYVCYMAGSIKKLVQREHIARGLQITNWGHSISRTVAEGALLHVLSCLRGASHWAIEMHLNGAWKTRQTRTASLFGRRVGIRGYGRVSHALINLLRPFGCDIGVFAPDLDDQRAAQDNVRNVTSLDELMSGHDVVVELAPLIPQTERSIKEEHLRLLKPGAVFVNVGRGATVDEDALERIAREGNIFVGLDVFSDEPLPSDSGFRGLSNVSLSPHLAGPTSDRRRDAGENGLRNLKAYLSGQPMQGVITLDVYDHST